MDYPPPQPRTYGIVYNSKKPIGGIYYYSKKKSPVVEVEYEEQKLTLKYDKTDTEPYIIEIQGKKVNFSQEGIERPELSKADQRWLSKAQNYFLSAKERNKRIGSAQDFTKMEILEALWATAKTEEIDPKRFIVQIYNESRFNPYAKGQSGERGIGQFKKTTAKQYDYDWSKISSGIEGFAYQAKVSANFVRQVGEVAYNGKGKRAKKYKNKISTRIAMINKASSECLMSELSFCQT